MNSQDTCLVAISQHVLYGFIIDQLINHIAQRDSRVVVFHAYQQSHMDSSNTTPTAARWQTAWCVHALGIRCRCRLGQGDLQLIGQTRRGLLV